MKLIFVSKYKWSHDKKRKKLRKLHKNNLVSIIKETNDGWLYSIPNTIIKLIK